MKILKKTEREASPLGLEQEIISPDSGFAVVEAYKTIRTNLMFALPQAGCKRIIVTSAMPKEGKSYSIVNLAITLALTNARVGLIDCDMRQASIHKILKLKGVPGLSEVLGRMEQPLDVIRETSSPELKVICAGTLPPNPAELLGSPAMAELLETLESECDYILMDTPPLNLVADTLALSKISDGVIMIVREGVTTHSELSKALSSLQFADAKILGLILNDVESRGGHRYNNYKYGESNLNSKTYLKPFKTIRSMKLGHSVLQRLVLLRDETFNKAR